MSEEQNAAVPAPEVTEQEMNQLVAMRIAKMNDFAAAGLKPYGNAFPNVKPIAEVRAEFKAPEAEGEYGPEVTIAGRIMGKRGMGKSIFADIKDSSGKIQLFVGKSEIGDEQFAVFKKIDISDIVGISGPTFVTRMGELSIRVRELTLLSKSLRPLPEKFHGLVDVEQRYRQRYLDLIMNDESKRVLMTRSLILKELRNYLDEKGYMEVETPMLQSIPGGAAATPFKTHLNALNTDVYLRIATELSLKKLLVGGFEKVYEVNRNFRNEGMDRKHNPEFTAIELYQAYGNCESMMELVEDMIKTLAMKINGTMVIHVGGRDIDLGKPWRRAAYKDLVKEAAGDDWFDLSREEKFKRAKELGAPVMADWTDLELTHEIYEKLVEDTLIEPTFVTRLPMELVPLARKCEDDPTLVDVYELEINGQEISPGYTELNDPIDQRQRLMDQVTLSGKDPAQAVDEDFLNALEYGMPPTGGMGMGIDRLVMLLTGADSIRDVILFPQMRIKK
ncbi:MAG: lysine--tRNA ligase [Lentisphaeria bacterium]|nr:lysine--tRNA ligase [Lentisphaeria bacterium]